MSNMESCVRYKRLLQQEGGNKLLSCQSVASADTASCNSTESYPKDPSPENGDLPETGDGLNNKTNEICRCNFCRTEWLTGKLTLKCYYCETGFLINPDDHFVCIECHKSLSSLSFVVRLCREIEETFHYWENDFYTKDDMPQYALTNMETNYNELLNCISGDNLRVVQLTLQIAKVFNAKMDFVKAAQLNHRAIRTLLGYQLSSVVDRVTFKESLECIDSIKQQHCEQLQQQQQQTDTNTVDFDAYLADAAELQLKAQNYTSNQLE